MRTGVLIYNENVRRFDIRFDLERYYGGLHCGECFEVKMKGRWVPTRIEMDGERNWYLMDIPIDNLTGLMVRI